MDFPDLALVKLAARDLTGPGVEFYARRISLGPAISASLGVTLPADQFSSERLYMLTWSFSLIPEAGFQARNARWYLSLPTIDIQLWAWNGQGYQGSVTDREDGSTPFLVIPGGKPMLFVADFNSVGASGNTMDGWIWGYSFPKGNVLSF